MKFRKKPVVVDVWSVRELWNQAKDSWVNLPKPIAAAYEVGGILFTDKGMEIKTLEGWMKANPDDMIICGIKGELYPCKPDVFEKTYEPVK